MSLSAMVVALCPCTAAGCGRIDCSPSTTRYVHTATAPRGCNPEITRCWHLAVQVHTTGQDVKQPFTGEAAVTLGKDMTLRDYKQGVWRMRGIGQGQSVCVVVVDEILLLLRDMATSCGFRLAPLPAAATTGVEAVAGVGSGEDAADSRQMQASVAVVAWLALNAAHWVTDCCVLLATWVPSGRP